MNPGSLASRLQSGRLAVPNLRCAVVGNGGGVGWARWASSSPQWRERQGRDAYVRQRKREGLRSRAAFKLREIAREHKLLRRGLRLVELGAAPGGWTQEIARRLFPHEHSRLVAVDLLRMDPLPDVDFIKGDFTRPEVQQAVAEIMGGKRVHGVLSDLAPSFAGDGDLDQLRQADLCGHVLRFSTANLTERGWLLMKVLQGADFDPLLAEVRAAFADVQLLKPKSSRAESRELYVLAKHLSAADDSH